jgi:predicted alpha/beta superfamily hydrolase
LSEIQAVLTALENAPALLASLIQAVPEPLRRRRPAPAKWSAHEHLCHVTSLEPRFRARLERMLTEDDPLVEPLSPAPEDQTGALLSLDLDEALAAFTRDRGELAMLLRGLPEEGWKRRAKHPDYESYNVFVLARHMAVHDMLHGYRIEETLQRREWPDEIPEAPPEPVYPVVEEGISGSLTGMKTGEVNLLGPFAVPGLAPRLIRIYLPRNYTLAEAHFGLYLFDGQNDFDDSPSFSGGWFVHDAVEKLAKTKRPVPVVIGIDHGGPERIFELSPFAVEEQNGKLEILLDWVTGHLMPALTAELNLVPGPFGAVIGGSSMGGLAAFWSHFRHPEAFGGSLVMSPSFWLSNQAIFADIAARPNPDVSRLYLDAGAREDRGRVVEAVKTMAEHLVGRGYDSDRLMWRADARGTHSESSWRRRLPAALRFMYRRG